MYNKLVKIYIDQSGKLEDTNKPTAIAFSNGKYKSLLISAKAKRQLQEIYRKQGKPKMYVFRTFGILIYIPVKAELYQISDMVVDLEYKGREDLIKDTFFQALKIDNKKFLKSRFNFALVGRNRMCHKVAINVYRKKQKSDLVISVKEILRYLAQKK